VGDASRFLDWLIDAGGGAVPRGNIELVPASGDREAPLLVEVAEPAVHQINLALSRVTSWSKNTWRSAERWDETRLYVFVAGHGIAPHGGDGASSRRTRAWTSWTQRRALLYRRWYQLSCYFHELVVFADCCRSAVEAPRRTATVHGTRRRAPAGTGHCRLRQRIGRSTYEGAAADDPNLRRGYFTEALLRGLREAATTGSAVGCRRRACPGSCRPV